MTLTRDDKKWLATLAALTVRAISEVIVGEFKTQISVDRAKDIMKFGAADQSYYLHKTEGNAS